jgi:hypothetical protein
VKSRAGGQGGSPGRPNEVCETARAVVSKLFTRQRSGYHSIVFAAEASMLPSRPALRRAAAVLVIGVVLVVTLAVPTWCVATGLWW